MLSKRMWLFSSINTFDFERISVQVERTRYVGVMPQVDRARDGCHPGPQSHRILADHYWERFLSIGHVIKQ